MQVAHAVSCEIFLSDQSREQGRAFLERVAALLMGSQHEDDAWRLD